jgi:hypothetical protein
MNARPPEWTPGYPLDHRHPTRVASLNRSYGGDFEWKVARVVARLMGEVVVLQDNGSLPGMVDMRIEYLNGRLGFVEVFSDTDEADAAMRAGLYGQDRTLPRDHAAPGLGRVWFVTVSSQTRLRSLMDELVPALADCERAGRIFGSVTVLEARMFPDGDPAAALWPLGVVDVSSRAAAVGEGGLVKLYPPGIRGSLDPGWDPLLEWVAERLASERVAGHVAKLRSAGGDERHFVLGVTESTPGDVYFALTDGPGVPGEPPQLGPGITHLWVMDTWLQRCLTWFPGRGWLDAIHNWATA